VKGSNKASGKHLTAKANVKHFVFLTKETYHTLHNKALLLFL